MRLGNFGTSRKALRRRLLEGVGQHGELFRHCIDRRDWEVMIAVFGEPHCAGHIFWQDIDPRILSTTPRINQPAERSGSLSRDRS